MVLRVLHLVGSAVSDFSADLSRLYARDCLVSTADPRRYEPLVAYVTPDGRWRFPEDLDDEAIAAAPSMTVGTAVDRLAALSIDVMVPQMFCLPGMTHYRALFDVLAIPYVGNAPEVMALTAHKARAKAVVSAAGVRVPRGEVLTAGMHPSMAPPVVVKPVSSDNSLGVGLVRSPVDYHAALASAWTHDDELLVEDYVELGREVRCGIVVRAGELVALPLEEYAVDSATKPVRGFDDKINRGEDGALNLVAKEVTRAWIVNPDDPLSQVVQEAARTCHIALGCRDYSLFDFRIDPDGRPWFLEAGLYCSFARQSVIPTMARAAGIPLDELFHTALLQRIGA